MRRALPALGLTAAGVLLVLRFQTSPTSSNHPTTVRASSGRALGSAGGLAPTTTAPAATGPTTSGAPGAAPTTAASGLRDGTFTGSAADTRYGPVQVQVTISGGKITDVQELQTPNDRSRSIDINPQAGPILHDEVLAAQSANIDQVSGATLTWEAYQVSLQAALDAAHR